MIIRLNSDPQSSRLFNYSRFDIFLNLATVEQPPPADHRVLI